MEELLNKLIEKGWKPFGNKKIKDAKTAKWNINLLDEKMNNVSKFKDKVAFTNGVLIFDEINMRELVSKESGLWQFVCEKGMVEIGYKEWLNEEVENGETISSIDEISMESYYYRLIESALCDEDKLEKFLLDKIKVDE